MRALTRVQPPLRAALAAMVANLTIGRKRYVDVDRQMQAVLTEAVTTIMSMKSGKKSTIAAVASARFVPW